MKKILAIDIGGTSIKYGIIAMDGKFIFSDEIKTRVNENENFILEDIDNLIATVVKNFYIEGVAISTAGVVCGKSGVITYAGPTIPNYKGTNFKKLVKEKYGLYCTVENDVNSAAVGEFSFGSGKNFDSVFCITVGTGLGGALIIDGKLIEGASGAAGEIGYLKINGENAQDIASTTALVREFATLKKVNIDEVNGKMIFQLAKEGDFVAIDVINNLVKNLMKVIENIIYIINPEGIILGGGIMEQRDYLEGIILKEFERTLPKNFIEKTKINFASLGNKAGLMGALYNFNNEINKESDKVINSKISNKINDI